MIVVVSDRSTNLRPYLERFKSYPVMAYDKATIKHSITTTRLATKKQLHELDLSAFFNYDIFPPSILRFKSQWEDEDRAMRVGDTIVQHAYLPPLRTPSLKLIFGVRISGIIDEPKRKGFSYETLKGHAERGISTFTIEASDDGLLFKIETYSTGGNMLSRLSAPFFARPYQAYCTRQALAHVRRYLA